MKIFEIENKYFFAHNGAVLVLESYVNPEEELAISFTTTAREYDKKFYTATVSEKSSNKKIIQITFSLSSKNSDLVIGTIEPFDDVKHQNLVHTSLGSYVGGADMGYVAMKWIQRKIRDFSKTQGYDIKKISSSTRGTGARARNNPGDDGTGMPKSFDISQSIKESLIYDCVEDTYKIVRKEK